MNRIKKISLAILLVLIVGLLIPQRFVMPVAGATKSDYNSKSFWYFPWGKSGTHKGVDIFAKMGTDVLSATDGVVLYSGKIKYLNTEAKLYWSLDQNGEFIIMRTLETGKYHF